MSADDPRELIAQLRALREEFGQRAAESGAAAAVARGQWFNNFLARLLRLYGIEAHCDQYGLDRRDEIDVAFRLGGFTFLVEAKWTADKTDASPVAKLRDRLLVRPTGVIGVLVSMAGYTPAVLDRARYEPGILLLQREHVEALVSGLIGPAELFESVLEHTGLRGGALAPLSDLLRPIQVPGLPQWTLAAAEDAATPLPDVVKAVDNATVTPLITTCLPWFSPWSGMVRDGEDLLLTGSDGIARVNPADGRGRWEHVIPGCTGSALRYGGELLAVCGHGVVALGPGEAVAPVGGPLDRGARLLSDGGENVYAFATTGPAAPPYRGAHLLTRLADTVGFEETMPIDFVGQIRQAAVLPGGRLYIAGGSYAGVVEIGPGMSLPKDTWFDAAPLSVLGAVLPLDEHRILSAGRDGAGAHVEIYLTDLRTREYSLLLRMTGNYPHALVRAERPGGFHLLMSVWGHASAPCAMLLDLDLPV